jgi:alpha-tubulin suppressor-like RCC1 family protein
VPGLDDVAAVAAGLGHTCALLRDGRAMCWGDNTHGQLGDGTREWRTRPSLVVSLPPVAELDCGFHHTCARAPDGQVWCFGSGVDGQLGDGTRGGPGGFRATPQRVELPAPATRIALGAFHGCAALEDGRVMCWGANDSGQLGSGTGGDPSDAALQPVAMSSFEGVVASLAPGGRHTCVGLADGDVRCTGFAHDGQLGDGTRTQRLAPVSVAGLADAIEVAAGARFSCARRSGGRVACWGRNEAGQLGDGTKRVRARPEAVR